MSLVYDDGSATIYQGDARKLPLPDESVHMVVISPPYNARMVYDGYEDWLPWEEYWQGLIEPSLCEAYRVLVHGGRLCVNIANVVRADVQPYRWSSSRKSNLAERKNLSQGGRKWCPAGSGGEPWAEFVDEHFWPLIRRIGFLPRERITWVKGAAPEEVTTGSTAWGTWRSATNPVLRAVGEPVYVLSKGTHAREPGQSDLTAEEFKSWTRNVWFISTAGQPMAGKHPAYFPLELPRRLIKLYSYVGDTVLDSFMGSGTTVWAAKLVGRRGIGVEQSAEYCRRAAERCGQGLLGLETPA